MNKVLIVIGLIFSFGCTQIEDPKTYKIGFSQCFSEDSWRLQMQMDMSRQVELIPNVSLVIKDGKGSTEKQILDIKEFLEEGIDALIVSPNESEPLTELINEVYRLGIPVVVVDRKIDNDNYSAYIGADNISVGRIAGELVTMNCAKSCRIVEVWGLEGSSPAKERHQGFVSYLESKKMDYQLFKIEGDWKESSITKSVIDKIIDLKPDVIYAQNDFMAAEIARKLSALNIYLPIIGTDGLSDGGGGMELVRNGTLTATVLYPTGGNEAVEIVDKILKGERFSKYNRLEAIAINNENVDMLLALSKKTEQLQELISEQNASILNGERVLNGQRRRFYLLISLIVLSSLTTIGLVWITMRNIGANKKLAVQNQQLEEQSEKLELLTRAQLESTDEKLRFFTNISHELKTPLALIKLPLEDVLMSVKDVGIKRELNLALKSVRRLSSLVDDLLDFRKIESDRVILSTYDVEVDKFFEIYFKEFSAIAKRMDIQFTFSKELRVRHVIFDPEAMDKIVTNLLSNAFKFTPTKGSIQFEVSQSAKNLKIRVVDSGTGIQAMHVPYIFDRYYQGNSGLFSGSGLGLALTKELVELHEGRIELETELGVGTIFTIRIPLKKIENEKVVYVGGAPRNYLEKRRLPLIERIQSLTPRVERDINETSPTILLVEDDGDFGGYLERKLSSRFNTIWFKDANSALNYLRTNFVDLIITDVMLPGVNGIEFVKQLRSMDGGQKTPVIVATAISDDQVRIDIKNSGSQEFLSKPFSIELLESTIHSLVRKNENVSSDSSQELKYKISAIIEKNFADPNFGTGELAQLIGMSRVQLYRKTKDLFKDSIGAVINSTRLSKAFDLIQTTELNISEIADQCGFSNASYFSKSIKMRYGFTPQQLRQQRLD
jgi:signal transduction histidine kinase/AraC-like DNA-binding protein